ncbi:twin transmembrane helix small protein [Aromatoleum buckelii]|uniref:Twin transmembrane helix small protein n=1 Tax=Aromatoleum buckelii TaxID=200254 RepID=A0ABX1N2R2_9RHOO|nr:twin transmembrane helix small protein [Aromatoleum buckelii]MCK0510716.1 twin transmembrane helix small protein [Aromatoleum buckelii]
MHVVVIVFLVLIVGSLASALVFLLRDQGKGRRTVHALALRVALSIALFVLLMAGLASGLITQRLGS